MVSFLFMNEMNTDTLKKYLESRRALGSNEFLVGSWRAAAEFFSLIFNGAERFSDVLHKPTKLFDWSWGPRSLKEIGFYWNVFPIMREIVWESFLRMKKTPMTSSHESCWVSLGMNHSDLTIAPNPAMT